MLSSLKISTGQFSHKGVKPVNQDFHGTLTPKEPQLSLKGSVVALADGISSSSVSQIASESAVASFLTDYFCTSDAWSVKTSGLRVIAAINGWLTAQTQQSEYRYNKDKGYVCTFSAAVFKAQTAHLFHIGDSRIYRIRQGVLEQLSKDHRAWASANQSYLSRALGVNDHVDIDYQAIALASDDVFILCTDGVYEHCDTNTMLNVLNEHKNDLNQAAQALVFHALNQGSQDNLTAQLVSVDALPHAHTSALQEQVDSLALPPLLKARDEIDGFTILRELHANSRSHVYLAKDTDESLVVIKIPSLELRDDPAYLERFLMEEWVARRIDNAHVMKAIPQQTPRTYLYTVMEYIDGISLKQWLVDNPKPELETVRQFIEQIAKGLQAMHRLEILHQDLKPDNVMIDQSGTLKIIDFGGVRVAGIAESNAILQQPDMQGTALYMAPEYFIGDTVSNRSEQFSLAVIAYHMLSGRFPYGTHVAKTRTRSSQNRVIYQSVLDDEREIPAWVDLCLRKALSVNPYKRYEELTEFVHELRHPTHANLNQTRPPLIERNPLLFWKGTSLFLAAAIVGLLVYINQLST
jgi:serine/threonine protein phosphatase PrpC